MLLILALVLAPHVGLLLLSFATVWSFSPLPDGYTLAHYARVLGDSSVYIKNTLLYSGLAAAIDVVIGGAIAYLVLRTRLPGRQMLDWARRRGARRSRRRAGHRLSARLLRRQRCPTARRSPRCGS